MLADTNINAKFVPVGNEAKAKKEHYDNYKKTRRINIEKQQRIFR